MTSTLKSCALQQMIAAIKNNDLLAVIGLLDEGLDPNGVSEGGVSPLLSAVVANNLEIAALLISRGADVNLIAGSESPLEVAMAKQSLAMIDLLIKLGANVNQKDFTRSTPVWNAAQKGHLDVLKKLVEAGGNLSYRVPTGNATPNSILFAALSYPETLEYLIQKGLPLGVLDSTGRTLLGSAAAMGLIPSIGVLLRAGMAVGVRDTFAQTALHEAARLSSPETIKVLLAAGADVNARDQNGNTPLHGAAQYGCSEIVATLLAHEAEVNVANNDLNTPLTKAAGSNRNSPEKVRLLIQAGAEIAHRDKTGNTALLHAVFGPDATETLEVLLEAGADLDTANDAGGTVKRLAKENRAILVFLEDWMLRPKNHAKHADTSAQRRARL